MPIISSRIAEDSLQADGRRWVREQYTDHVGGVHERVYMALAAQVIDLQAQVAALNQQLIDEEIQRNLAAIYADGPLAVVSVVHASTAQNGAAVREVYKTVTREQVWALGAFLNTLTNPQIGNLFGVSGAPLTALRTRLQAAATKWTEYLEAAGE